MSKLTDQLNHWANWLWRMDPRGYGERAAQTKLVAHRGAYINSSSARFVNARFASEGCLQSEEQSMRFENTLPAFRKALELGAWGIEMDIQMTRDQQPVIHHDPHCGRVFNRADIVISQQSFADIRSAIPDIPHLQEVVDMLASQVHLMLEIKNDWRAHKGMIENIEAILKGLQPQQDFHLLSLVPDYLEGFSGLPKACFIDVCETNTAWIVNENKRLGHGAIAGSFALISTRLIQDLHQSGKQVGTGMIEHPTIMQRETCRQVDWLFSDNLEELLHLQGTTVS